MQVQQGIGSYLVSRFADQHLMGANLERFWTGEAVDFAHVPGLSASDVKVFHMPVSKVGLSHDIYYQVQGSSNDLGEAWTPDPVSPPPPPIHGVSV